MLTIINRTLTAEFGDILKIKYEKSRHSILYFNRIAQSKTLKQQYLQTSRGIF